MRTVIVGGGWSGLAAAVELSRHGHPVTLVDAADQLGGRARRVEHARYSGDNGQHLLIGAYREILTLLARIGIPESEVFERRRLELRVRSLSTPGLTLRLPRLPAPLQLVMALLRADGVSGADKRRALRICLAALRPYPEVNDRPLGETLERLGQSERLIGLLWEPLCLATLNTPLAEASTAMFLHVLRESFSRRRADSDLLIARTDLGALFPDPARAFIERHGGEILLGRRVTTLKIVDDRISALTLNDGSEISARDVIVALPAPAMARLLAPHEALTPIATRLEQIRHEPITTVFLHYPSHVRLDFPLYGLHDTLGHWVFDRGADGQHGLMSVVISGGGRHMEMDNETLARGVAAELAQLFRDWPSALEHWVIREKRATFVCAPGINALRPDHSTPVTGCWLAGDATATGLPATLEGAVRSGLAGARQILAECSGLGPAGH